MLKESLRSRLEDFIFLENKVRKLFKDKLDNVKGIKGYTKRMETAARAWREDKKVISILEELKKVADDINLNFMEYKLSEILKLWLFFIGLHEEWFFKHDGSHLLSDLIQKPAGYSFNSVMSYVSNRWEEATTGKKVWENNMRIEMAMSYICIFLSRILYSPYIDEKVKDIRLFQSTLEVPIKNLINNQMSLSEISSKKMDLNRSLEDFREDILSYSLTKEKWRKLVSISLKNFINLISIADYLKNEIYDTDYQLLRPSFFERSKEGWTTRAMMCRFFNGQYSNPKFPFGSIKPRTFVMYGY